MIRQGVHKSIEVSAALRLNPRPAHCNLDGSGLSLLTIVKALRQHRHFCDKTITSPNLLNGFFNLFCYNSFYIFKCLSIQM